MKLMLIAVILLAFVGIGMGPAKGAGVKAAQSDPNQVLQAFTEVMVNTFETHNESCVEYMFTAPIAGTAELMMSEYARCMGEHYLVFETFLINKHHEKYLEN